MFERLIEFFWENFVFQSEKVWKNFTGGRPTYNLIYFGHSTSILFKFITQLLFQIDHFVQRHFQDQSILRRDIRNGDTSNGNGFNLSFQALIEKDSRQNHIFT